MLPACLRLPVCLGLSALAGCSLTTGLGGLSGGGEPADGGTLGSSEAGVANDGGAADDASLPDGGPPSSDASTYVFSDDFGRPDNPMALGNGWREKTQAFMLWGGAAVRVAGPAGDDYRNNIASRPDGEAVRDVDVSMKFTFLAAGGGWVQLHARAQTSTIATAGALDSYVMFRNMDVSDDRTFVIARQRGNATWVGLAELKTGVALQGSSQYRMRLTVKGESPVLLEGTIEAQAQGVWNEIGRATASDSDPAQITGAGVVGISSGNDPTGTYAIDDFEARGL